MSERPVALDLCVGLGGWVDGLTAEGWHVIGVDIEDMFAALGEPKPEHFELRIEDICNVRGADYAFVDLIVGSSPCQDFSYRAMPWSRAKALHAPFLGMWLFWQQFRIQREASEAAGRHIPMVVENVKGAQPWVGRARFNFGSYYLWGDTPALMPRPMKDAIKIPGRTMCYPPGSANPDAVKGRTGKLHWVDDGMKNEGGSWFNIGSPGQKVTGQNPVHAIAANEARKVPGFRFDGSGRSFQTASVEEGRKGAGAEWFDGNLCVKSSKSSARKAASAKIAKIPISLSRWIAQVYFPHAE